MASSLPSMELFLTPKFDLKLNLATSVSCRMIITGHSPAPSERFLELILLRSNVPSNRYDGSALQATDLKGELQLVIEDDGNTRFWHTARDSEGPVTLSFEAFPRQISRTTPLGPRVDLRAEQGGLIGTGVVFVPVPPDRQRIFENTIHWDLSFAPENTTAAWTFGDGIVARKQGVPNDILVQSVYAVGPLKSYIRHAKPERGEQQEYGFYWFGDPPFDALKMAKKLEQLYAKMRVFFRDQESSYRIFVRKHPFRGFGGGAYTRSFILEYADKFDASQDEIFMLLCHEMVHNWPSMQCAAGSTDEDEVAWYIEGVAEYYMSVLPYRFGLHTREEFLKHINTLAVGYYTNPYRNETIEKTYRDAWKDPMAQIDSYGRGAIHLHLLNAKIKNASGGRRSIDDLVLDFLAAKNRGESHDLEAWLRLLQNDLGSETLVIYNNMANGVLMMPGDVDFGETFEMIRDDKFFVDLGFDPSSYSKREPIKGLVKGSRAEEAGVMNGDVIVDTSRLAQTVDNYDAKMNLVVNRNGERKYISYWPKGRVKHEAWSWK